VERLWTRLWNSPAALCGGFEVAYGASVKPSPPVRFVLDCEECGVRSDELGRGWRAAIVGDDDAEHDVVVVYCPDCWEREFGDS
jgi:hypothetical protein